MFHLLAPNCTTLGLQIVGENFIGI